MVPVDSVEVPRDSTYSGYPPQRRQLGFRVRACHPLWTTFPDRSANRLFCNSLEGPTTPRWKPPRFGLFPFRSPLLRKSIFLSFPAGTEMFQFSAFAARVLWIQTRPVRVSRDHHLFDGFPGLIAVFRALRSLLTPRHPPCALWSLTTRIECSPQQSHQFPGSPREELVGPSRVTPSRVIAGKRADPTRESNVYSLAAGPPAEQPEPVAHRLPTTFF